MVGHRALSPLARAPDDMSMDIVEYMLKDVDTSNSNAVAGPSNLHAVSPADIVTHPPPSKPLIGGSSTNVENPQGVADPVHDPGFFGGPLPVCYTQGSQLTVPLHQTMSPIP
jgi:hypothetical protein